MKSAEENRLKRDVTDVMRKHPAVVSAHIFGSFVAGTPGKSSDIDIAVRVGDGLTPEMMFDLRLRLIGELEDRFERAVDVVVLNTASLKLIHQVMKTGRMVYAADAKKEEAFRLQKQKEYFDFKYHLENDREALETFFE